MQDFTKKLTIVMKQDLPLWQTMNAVAHIAAYLGNKMNTKFDTGNYFKTQDNKLHPRNSQYPIIILKAGEQELNDLIKKIRSTNFLYLGFVQEMLETTDDKKLAEIIGSKNDDNMNYLGIGIFGEKERVGLLTRKFSLWK